MSSLTTLARPYAKAAFELARSDDNLAYWDDMLSAVAVVTADESMARWLQSPFATEEKAVEIIVEAIGGEIDPRFEGYLTMAVCLCAARFHSYSSNCARMRKSVCRCGWYRPYRCRTHRLSV